MNTRTTTRGDFNTQRDNLVQSDVETESWDVPKAPFAEVPNLRVG